MARQPMRRAVSTTVRSVTELQRLIKDNEALTPLLNEIGSSLRRRVLRHGGTFELVAPGFDRRFMRPFKTISKISFAPIHTGAAFQLDTAANSIVFNIGHVVGMLEAVVLDLDSTTHVLHPNELGRLVRLAIELLILHEVRHSSQGVAKYSDVQLLKRKAEMLIGEFDLLADRDAAHGYALLRSVEERVSDTESYLRFFAEALFFMGQFCFPAFKIPLSKPSKVSRALGLTLMLARLTLADREDRLVAIHSSHLPLDAALMPEISEDWRKLTIFAYTPDLQLVAIDLEIDPDITRSICERLDDGNFEVVLEDAIRLIRRIQIV